MNAIPTFSTITLHNCLLLHNSHIQITLNASASFPGCRVQVLHDKLPPPTKAWAALPVSQDSSHLDLTLMELIGEGRIGITYAARVNAANDASGVDLLASGLVPSEVCLKIAKPHFCRSMAREAWFYEQLRPLQGIATARCFGFFTATVEGARTNPSNESEASEKGPVTVVPWAALKARPEHMFKKTHWPSEDFLIDDSTAWMYTDEHGFKKNSPWNAWQHSEDKPLLSVLVLEKLGESYYLPQDEPKGEEGEAVRSSLRDIVYDIATIGISHGDITAFNILRAPPGSKATCPTHNCVHEWRITDFDRSTKIDPDRCHKGDILTLLAQPRCIGVAYRGFWGSIID
ncbi:unnamed protein product [Cyclocybe aegerita]|uniref:Protein kinase domain-containing protein n=1 Tax=Cyclocybe aegerita TaxID=1973307 RepID=A0A8S0WX04_CYCAE|nr:unnamed protein product [Cyclocybe aegerita]